MKCLLYLCLWCYCVLVSSSIVLICNGGHEYYECGGACDNVCADLHIQNKTNCPIINIRCNDKCYCEDGYARDVNGKCIPIKDCPKIRSRRSIGIPVACGYKEIEVSCPKNCTYDSCPKSADEKNECKSNTKSGEDNDESCVPGCKCAFNYRRAENGTCIPTRACPPFDCPGENEHYDPCPPYCTDNCGALKADGTCNIVGRIGVILQCFPKCRCNKGYGRLNGICVPNSDCKKN